MMIPENIQRLYKKLHPFHGVIVFVLVMFIANWLWKFFVHDGNYDPLVTLFGFNITWPFREVQLEIVRVAGLVFELFDIPFTLVHRTLFVFDNNQSTEIAWGCTGLKQAFIFSCIIFFSRGPWKHKWWYIIVGVLAVHVVNVSRISLMGIVMHHNPQSFDLVHTYFFKYIFYLIIFLMWVLWEEIFYTRRRRKAAEKIASTPPSV